MALPYRLYGGATRPDALNFNPAFGSALTSLYNAAPPEVQRELGLTSGYRSPEVQARLWEASDKTGRTVARPGHSKHQHGTAADLYGFGLSGAGRVSDATRQWVKANAEAHGLYFPMDYEPWHIQLRGDGSAVAAGGGGGGTGGGAASSLGSTMAGAVDPRAIAMAQLEHNPWKTITDVAPKRGGLVGEGSAGVTAGADADPGIPPLETAAARVPTTPLTGGPGSPDISGQLGRLANLFKVKQVGQPQPTEEGMLPQRRFA
jgi:hypothetical protein